MYACPLPFKPPITRLSSYTFYYCYASRLRTERGRRVFSPYVSSHSRSRAAHKFRRRRSRSNLFPPPLVRSAVLGADKFYIRNRIQRRRRGGRTLFYRLPLWPVPVVFPFSASRYLALIPESKKKKTIIKHAVRHGFVLRAIRQSKKKKNATTLPTRGTHRRLIIIIIIIYFYCVIVVIMIVIVVAISITHRYYGCCCVVSRPEMVRRVLWCSESWCICGSYIRVAGPEKRLKLMSRKVFDRFLRRKSVENNNAAEHDGPSATGVCRF